MAKTAPIEAKTAPSDDASTSLVSVHDVAACGYQIGFGSLCGYASGLAMRKFGSIVAYTLGTGFIILQSLQYKGYLSVNWRKVERDYVQLLDVDGDGAVTSKDFNLMSERLKDVLMFDLPAGIGFGSGWIMGLGGPASIAGGVGTAGVLYGVGSRVLLPRVAATTGATTGGPALLVGVQDWWRKTKTTLGVASPEEQFQQTIAEFDYHQLKNLKSQFEKEHRRAASMLPFDVQMLEMKQKVVEQQLLKVPPPPKPWWKLW
eukprot:EG_transcript_18355